jgi:hypothetical protein
MGIGRLGAALLVAAVLAGLPGASGPAEATSNQRAAAADLVSATRAEMTRYRNVDVALADGYRRLPGQAGIVHFENDAYLPYGLDPRHPQSLVYLEGRGGMRLVAAMFLSAAPGVHGQRVGGALTQWHVHVTCYGAAGPAQPDHRGRCPAGDAPATTPEMLHVWAADVGGNPFASSMSPYTLQCQLTHLGAAL